MKQVYLDYAATTPVDKDVIEAMMPYYSTHFGNASSLHSFGEEAFNGMETARDHVSSLIGSQSDEIIFTSGGTESDNAAVKGVAFIMKKQNNIKKGPHVITSTIEHPGVLQTCRFLEDYGFQVKYLPVDSLGKVDIAELEEAISRGTFLVSIMHANNEIGTLQAIKEIGKIARDHDIFFHTDAVQSVGKEPINVDRMNIDMLSLSGHKMYGPKGVGALFVREGISLEPLLHGGGHQKGLRSGTENIPGIVGLGKACELAKKRMSMDRSRLKKLRDCLIKGVEDIKGSYLNGHPTERLVNNAHFRFSGVEGESIIMRLNQMGIAASTGSACSSKELEASHVLRAMGIDEVEAHGSVRFSLGRGNSDSDVGYVLDTLPGIISELRAISSLWHDET